MKIQRSKFKGQNCKSKFKIKIKLLTFILLTLTFNFVLLSFNLRRCAAITMFNSNYTIQMGNLNMASGNQSGPNNKLGFTMGQIAPGLYSKDGVNYKVRAGFQYIHSIISFRFSIAELAIDFGVLSPTNPVTRENTLTITNGSAFGYTVSATESSQLINPASGALIADTTCDNGTCTEIVSAAWTSNLTYGFGYRCDNISGTDCASGFSDSTFYKQFSDTTKQETPQAVMTGTAVGKNKKARVTYKVNISGTQPPGTYRNYINYIAAPNF